MKEALAFFSLFIPNLAFSAILEGVAKTPKGDVLYLERHHVDLDAEGLNKFIKVEYLNPDGSLFATMTSDFSNHKTLPETTFEDSRFSTKTTLRVTEKNIQFEEVKNGITITKKEIPFTSSMVASQGFDNFIKLNFSKLQVAPLEFKFGVLEKKDFYSLTGFKKIEKGEDIEFGIKASSWLARLFAGELKVVYHSKTKRLKSFSGRSNILDKSGQSQNVVINYQWKNAP